MELEFLSLTLVWTILDSPANKSHLTNYIIDCFISLGHRTGSKT